MDRIRFLQLRELQQPTFYYLKFMMTSEQPFDSSIFTFSDSANDIPMSYLTDEDALAIWTEIQPEMLDNQVDPDVQMGASEATKWAVPMAEDEIFVANVAPDLSGMSKYSEFNLQ